MSYERKGRGNLDPRDMEAKTGIIKNADGSAMFRSGNTIAYAAVYGPRDLYPRFMKNPETGILRCFYNMMPFSGMGDRIRPGGNRRSKEISLVTKNALEPVVDLKDFPNAVVDVFIEFPQTDAGSRCAGITAAAMALADSGIPMKDMVAACAVGNINGTTLVDLDYEEEAHEGEVADIPIAMSHRSGEIGLLQLDGFIDKEQFKKSLTAAKAACDKIHEVQVAALKARYGDKK